MRKGSNGLVLGHGIGLLEVWVLLVMASVGRFGYGAMLKGDNGWWVMQTWGDILGYSLDISILSHGRYLFKFRREEDMSCILRGIWLLWRNSLMLQRWYITFNPQTTHIRFKHLWVILPCFSIEI